MTLPSTPPRIVTATECLPLTATERVLEVGCGVGHAAEHLLAEHPDLTYVAVDRSAKAVEATLRRNARFVDQGRCRVVHADLTQLTAALGADARFDLAFANNVNVFWTKLAVVESAALARHHDPCGELVLLYQLPDEARLDRVRDQALRSLTGAHLVAQAGTAAGHLVICARQVAQTVPRELDDG